MCAPGFVCGLVRKVELLGTEKCDMLTTRHVEQRLVVNLKGCSQKDMQSWIACASKKKESKSGIKKPLDVSTLQN
jgi:hypothetical protein